MTLEYPPETGTKRRTFILSSLLQVAKAKEDAEAEAVEKVTEALKEADRRISEAAVGARRNEDSVTVEANRRVSAAEEASLVASFLRRYSPDRVKDRHRVIGMCRVYEDRARS